MKRKILLKFSWFLVLLSACSVTNVGGTISPTIISTQKNDQINSNNNTQINVPDNFSISDNLKLIKDEQTGISTISDEIFVKAKNQEELNKVVEQTNGKIIGGDKSLSIAQIKLPYDKNSIQTTQELQQKGIKASTDYLLDTNLPDRENQNPQNIQIKPVELTDIFTNDPFWDNQNQSWGMRQTNINQAWSLASPEKIKIASIDIAFEENHEDLNIKIAEDTNNNKTSEAKKHGNEVSGIINAIGNNKIGISGIMQGKADYSIYMCNKTAFVAQSIKKAADNGVKVLNISIQFIIFKDPVSDDTLEKKVKELNDTYFTEAVKYAQQKGMLIIVAAGNGLKNSSNTFSRSIDTKFNPFAILSQTFDNLIIVGGVQQDGQLYFSSNFGDLVNIGAPGNSVYTTSSREDGNYNFVDGTSIATPFITGISGLLLSKFPNLTYKQIKESIINSSDKKIPEQKFSFVDAKKAIIYAQEKFNKK